jgi:glycosyltransferase involved in cell wall biosynthesis
MSRRVVVLLPAFNESAQIGRVVRAAQAVKYRDYLVTILVVDDGSSDGTAEVARAAGAEVVSHQRNRGVGAAFRTGLEWAKSHHAEFLVHLDSDGQIDPAEIPLVMGPVAGELADLAIGTRFSAGAPEALSGWKGSALTATARAVGFLTGQPLTDLSCGFRCLNRRVMDAVSPSFDFDYIQEVLIQALAAGARVVEVPVRVSYAPGSRAGLSSRVVRYGARFLGLTAWSMAQFYRRKLFR